MLRSSILPAFALGAWLPLLGQDPASATATKGAALAASLDPEAGSVLTPDDLSPTDWSGIRAAWNASRHTAFAVEGGWRASNPGQAWHMLFDGRGVSVWPATLGWEWGLELLRYGFAGAERAVSESRATSSTGQRVAYDWDEILEEWYVNDARGLEHGFTLDHRPPAKGRAEPGPLTLTLGVRGGLLPEVLDGRRGVRFVNGDGAPVLTYAGLTVLDADRRELTATFELAREGLLLSIDEREAHYPLTIDPLVQQAYLKASNTEAGDDFGESVAISGVTVVVGATSEGSDATGVNGDQSNNNASNSGAAYVFVRNGTTWSQQAYLKASNTGSNDGFGWSVWASGDTVVIGAPFEDSNATGTNGDQNDNGASSSGAAYVFVRNGTSWSQQAYLKASNTDASDRFGESVAVSGDTLVVGAQSEDSNATGVNGDQSNNNLASSGAAYVFTRSGASWSQQAYLKASNSGLGDAFGRSVAAAGELVVVGALTEGSSATGVNGDENDNSAVSAGAAYVFVSNGTTWSQEAYLKASNTGAGDLFGGSVAVSGETVVVGAYQEDSNATGVNGDQSNNTLGQSGAAYVFVRSGTTWSQEAYLKASNTGPFDEFGRSVAVSGDTVIVGAPEEDSNALGPNGDQDDNSASGSGAAYLFVRTGTSWNQQTYLKASNTGLNDIFGQSVAVSAGSAMVGAPLEDSNAFGVNGDQDSNSAAGAGAAYVFQVFSRATVVFRNAGSNPASYVASPITIGFPFTATVDNTLAVQPTSLLFGFDTPTSFPLGGGQVLLCHDQASGEIFTGLNLAPTSSAGGVDTYSLAVPNDPALAGFTFFSQAIHLGNVPFVLSNAQDFTVGGF